MLMDKTKSYQLPHGMGVVCFGSKFEVVCHIDRDLDKVEV